MKKIFLLLFLSVFTLNSYSIDPTDPGTIYSEKDVPPYDIHDVLTTLKGKKVTTVAQWEKLRRPEILKTLSTEMYGFTPTSKVKVKTKIIEINKKAINGKATRKQIELTFIKNKKELKVQVLVYFPNKKDKPAPAFAILNFCGNQSIEADSVIVISETLKKEFDKTVLRTRNPRTVRGGDANIYPIERIIDNGLGFATAWYGDFDPDYYDGFENGVHGLLHKKGQKHGPNDWGSLGAWAWGLSRILDYLETDKDFDATKVAVIGHSRNAKAAIWAAAQDRRFAMCIPNNSGCGGTALMKRIYGETASSLNRRFPHWMCENFKKYINNEDSLTIDSYDLIGLIAPRPLYIGSAEGDQWADPHGEFLGMLYAQPVYQLYGIKKFPYDTMTPLGFKVIKSQIGYHYRTGYHALTPFDWEAYIEFAKFHFKSEPNKRYEPQP